LFGNDVVDEWNEAGHNTNDTCVAVAARAVEVPAVRDNALLREDAAGAEHPNVSNAMRMAIAVSEQRKCMKTYSDIKAEIAKLEKQAEALRKAEVAGVVTKIKVAIAAYSLTAADLGLGGGLAKAARPSKAKSSKTTGTTTGVAKYRDPKTGKTWTGRGKPPTWIAGVKNRDAYLIDGPAADTAGATPPKQSAKGTQKARVATQPAGKKKSSPTKKGARISRKTQPAPVMTPAVQIESGVASA
jgi:DNA-binding protein H-NS